MKGCRGKILLVLIAGWAQLNKGWAPEMVKMVWWICAFCFEVGYEACCGALVRLMRYLDAL